MKPVEKTIYLASKSPRRRELLRQVGIDFELLLLRSDGPRGPDVTEDVQPGEAPLDYVSRVAREKAAFAADLVLKRRMAPRVVLAADTTVTIDGAILGKPATPNEAIAMLQQLSGRTHQVLTAIAVHSADFAGQITQVSDVTFGVLSPAAISAYCATSEPYDRPAATASRARPRSSSSTSPAAIPASWACRCTRPHSCCGRRVCRYPE